MKIYLVRHGQSATRQAGLTEQEIQTPLSENGLKQAEFVAGRLSGLGIDLVYSSPYLRAKDTAEVIARKIGKPIEYWGELIEADSSKENFGELNQRSKKILEHLISNHKNQVILCVSHATMIEVIIAKMIFGENLSDEIMTAVKQHFGTTNTGISICEFTEKEGWMLLTFNDSSHL